MAAIVALALAVIAPSPARADDLVVGVGPRELWVGADVGANTWLVYSGGTYAANGDVHRDGFRLRATSGYGAYSYQWDSHTRVAVTKTYADILAGYQFRWGELTTKAFAGWAILDDIDVPSAGRRIDRLHDGVKGALELWLNLGPDAFTSLDLSYADTRDMTSVRSRTGYRVMPTVSTGIETTFNHTTLSGQVQVEPGKARIEGALRIGAFVRYEWFGGEISAAAGIAGDTMGLADTGDLLHRPSAYGTVNWISQF